MSEYKSFEELKEELGKDYDYKLYEMGLSALKEIERLNNIINELEEYLNKCYEEINSKKSTHNLQEELQLCSYLAIYEKILNKLQELKGSDKE